MGIDLRLYEYKMLRSPQDQLTFAYFDALSCADNVIFDISEFRRKTFSLFKMKMKRIDKKHTIFVAVVRPRPLINEMNSDK